MSSSELLSYGGTGKSPLLLGRRMGDWKPPLLVWRPAKPWFRNGSSLDFESVGAPLVGALFGPNHATRTLWNDLGRRCREGDHKGRPYANLRDTTLADVEEFVGEEQQVAEAFQGFLFGVCRLGVGFEIEVLLTGQVRSGDPGFLA